MGWHLGKRAEINIIQSGNIWYKKSRYPRSFKKILGNTAIVYIASP
ncbi:MAG: hypothetical protein IPO48_14610 [Saprospiraceae bacterium]|nr:hypothetical protein [Saprospiraceae bacterium]